MTRIAKGPLKIRRMVRSVGCREDHQCPTGFFCEVTVLSCRECLSCASLNRQPRPANMTSCVTSVAACGGCLAGLVPTQTDDKCVSPSDGQLLLPYEWAVISVGLMLAVIICAAAVYVLRNFETFKVLASSTRTSVHSTVDVEASAPQPPPSYNDVTASSPANQCRSDDETAPFIKAVPSPPAGHAREAAGCQAARVFNNPSYVRTLQPPSYESPNPQAILSTIPEAITDNGHNESSNANAMIPEVEESRANEISRALSAKLIQAEQDSNNNSEGDGDARDQPSFAPAGTAFIINVIKNVNTVHQRNQLTV